MENKITLSTQDWHFTCGDGCCDEYGENLFINGEKIDADIYIDAHDAIEKVLKYLGYEVQWEELETDRMDLRSELDDEYN